MSDRVMVEAVEPNERAFRKQILELARMLGWDAYFTWTSIHSPAGFPDLVLVRGPRLIFAELKTNAGKTTRHQDKWLYHLSRTSAEVYLWRPRDFERIVEILQGNVGWRQLSLDSAAQMAKIESTTKVLSNARPNQRHRRRT